MANRNNASEKVSRKNQNMAKRDRVENTTPKQEKAPASLTADAFKGTYQTSTALNVREQADPDAPVRGVLNIGTIVSCDGRYAVHNGIRYLYITVRLDDMPLLEGYCQIRFLIKQQEVKR